MVYLTNRIGDFMLKIKNLGVEVDNKRIIDDLDLTIGKDEIHVIMGPNGVGKSTICKVIMGDPSYKITNGYIKFMGEDIVGMPTNEISKRGIFYLMQSPTEIPGVTNAEMLRTALVDRGYKESIFEFNKHMNEAVDKLHIDKEYIHHNINENMSGGEKKKNELLQIYMLKPSLILLDEMDSGLDVDSLNTLSNALLEYKKDTKCSILIITHHTNILKYMHPDKVHILENGHITLEGDALLAEKIEEYGFRGTSVISESECDE